MFSWEKKRQILCTIYFQVSLLRYEVCVMMHSARMFKLYDYDMFIIIVTYWCTFQSRLFKPFLFEPFFFLFLRYTDDIFGMQVKRERESSRSFFLLFPKFHPALERTLSTAYSGSDFTFLESWKNLLWLPPSIINSQTLVGMRGGGRKLIFNYFFYFKLLRMRTSSRNVRKQIS